MPALPASVALGIRWKRELGMSHVRAAALVAAVTAFDLDGFPVWHSCVNTLVAKAGGPTRAGEELTDLAQLGLLTVVGRVHQVPLYAPTVSGVVMARAWAGERRAVAA